MKPTLIWDIPTRIFHWIFVLCFAMAWLTCEGDRWRSIHVFAGYLMLALVVFRVVWGFVGSHFSRFASFWFGPREAILYLQQVAKGHAARHVGHNPTGSMAIYILLGLAIGVGVSGWITLGGDEQQGLAAGWLSFSQAQPIKELHEVAAWLMLMVVAGHVTGVVVESLLHRENLTLSMLTGVKMAPPDTPVAKSRTAVAVVLLLAMLVFGLWWFQYAIDRQLDHWGWYQKRETGVGEESHVRFVGKNLPDHTQWREECGSCHAAFYPALLPERSWRKMMADQGQHFGTDLGLDAAPTAAILQFLTDNAADHHRTEAAFKIDQSIPKEAVPLRITDTPYWTHKHSEMADAVWTTPSVKSKNNCIACHTDADAGTFEDGAMQIPQATAVSKPASDSAAAVSRLVPPLEKAGP